MEEGTQTGEFQEKYVKKTQFKWLKKQSKATRKKGKKGEVRKMGEREWETFNQEEDTSHLTYIP